MKITLDAPEELLPHALKVARAYHSQHGAEDRPRARDCVIYVPKDEDPPFSYTMAVWGPLGHVKVYVCEA